MYCVMWMQLSSVPQVAGKSQPPQQMEHGFQSFHALQANHRAGLEQSFARDIAPAIKAFRETVSSDTDSLGNRLKVAIESVKQSLLELGVTKDLEMTANELGQAITPLSARYWLSGQLSRPVVAEIEKVLEQGTGLGGTDLPTIAAIDTSYREATAPRHGAWNVEHWRGATYDRVHNYISTKLRELKEAGRDT